MVLAMVNNIIYLVALLSIAIYLIISIRSQENSHISAKEIIGPFISFCSKNYRTGFTFILIPGLIAFYFSFNQYFSDSFFDSLYITIPIMLSVLDSTEISKKDLDHSLGELLIETNEVRLYGVYSGVLILLLSTLIIITELSTVCFSIIVGIIYLLFIQFILIVLFSFKRKVKAN